MAVSANSYGTSAKVAGYAPRYAASSGNFDTSTNPTNARVEGIIDRVSGLVNVYLKALGFTIPLTNADNVLAMDNIVIEIATTVVEGIRGSGRYAPNSKHKPISNRNASPHWIIPSSAWPLHLPNLPTNHWRKTATISCDSPNRVWVRTASAPNPI